MNSQTHKLILTEAQGKCLEALKSGIETKMKIALAAKLDLLETSDCLEKLMALRLVEREDGNRWHATRRGTRCSFDEIPDGESRKREKPGPSAQRLLDALDHPMHQSDLARRLGMSREYVRRLAVMLHAHGQIRYCDHQGAFRIITRSEDPTVLLTGEEVRFLSVLSNKYATGAVKIRTAARITEERANIILARLLDLGFIEELPSLGSTKLYGITKAGLTHPQYDHSAPRAEPPSLPFHSDRVLAVLSYISDAAPVRIRDVGQMLGIPYDSNNALFQYLKRKSLVRKISQERNAPYALTDEGREALTEMMRRQAA